MIILLSISTVLFFTLFLLSLIREKKREKISTEIIASYITYLNKISDIIEFSKIRLREIDEKGSFKTDDEVGYFFDNLLEIQSLLNNFIIKDFPDENQDQKKENQ